MVTWMIEPIDKNLNRSGNPIRFWSSLTVVERHNVSGDSGLTPGSWSLTGLSDGLADLFETGAGVLISRDGEYIMTGPVTSVQRNWLTCTIDGFSHDEALNDRILYPDPTHAITAQPVAYDNRSGPAESVLLAYIKAELGSGALTTRRLANLRLPADEGRGSSVAISGRLEALGTTVSDIAESGGLHVDVRQNEDTSGPYLEVLVREVADLSADVRFGSSPNDFTGGLIGLDWSYTVTRPTVTDVIVAGQGQGTERLFVEQVDSDAEAAWGVKIEQLVDRRDIDDGTDTTDDEMTQAASDALSAGSNPVSFSFTVTNSPDFEYRRDWRVGDTIGVFLDGMDLSNPVREVTTSVVREDGALTETVSAVVGSRDSSNWSIKPLKDVAKALQQVGRLQTI